VTSTGITTGTGDGCPAREEMHAWFTVDLPPEQPFTGECMIDSVSENGNETTLSLSCEGPPLQPVTLTIDADPPLVAAHLEGLAVELLYRANMPFWIEQWLVMQTSDPLVVRLFIVDGPTLEPPDGPLIQEGIGLAEVDGLCVPTPGECATEERFAIDVMSAGDSRRMFDGSLATVGRHDVLVSRASINHPPINCTDLPARWITLVAVDAG